MLADDITIKPTTDLFIAALWSAPKNEPILRSLLNGVMTNIGQPAIVKATVLNPFNIQENPVDKQIRLDVLVEDETKKRYNIEVQTDPHPGFFNRMLYYWAETYSARLQRGKNYKELRPVYSIVITEFPVFPQLTQLHAVFEIRAKENHGVLLSDHFQMHVLRLGDMLRNNLSGLDDLCKELQRWMQFWALGEKLEEREMSTMLHDTPEVLQAYEEYKRFTADPVMWEKIRARERFEIDQQLRIGEAKREGREETARNFKRLGVSIATIAEATGLSVSEIERLN
ncbi:MAG: Rpn family recombination-promoting nuclease/putative transposase [Planctomycetaceae bacterium]|nr:Rpn family recombination-promoting nuclease/putative transposase [Planctomycetaceae bacterium]